MFRILSAALVGGIVVGGYHLCILLMSIAFLRLSRFHLLMQWTTKITSRLIEDYTLCFGTSPKVSWRKIIVDLIDLLKGVISWVVPRKIVITEIEVVGHLDVVRHGNPNDPIVHAELRLKHEERPAGQSNRPQVKVKIKAKRLYVRTGQWDLSPAEQMEEELVRRDNSRESSSRKNACYNRHCGCQIRGKGHDNRKTLRRKEERRATISYRNYNYAV